MASRVISSTSGDPTMSRRKRKVDELTNLAAELSGEDGGDPVAFHRKPWDAPKQSGRKGQQLCGQVKDALHVALAGCADEVLQGLRVVSVEPAPHTGRLRVLVAAEDPTTAQDALTRAAGFLRAQVASAVSRRYAPELVFEVIE
jgi:ribosome-binding factor A